MSHPDAVGAYLPITEDVGDYHRRIAEFGTQYTSAFLRAGKESSDRQHLSGEIERVAKENNRDPNELRSMYAVDAKFACLAAATVIMNIADIMPQEHRGRLLSEVIDYLMLNINISEESMKHVLGECLMRVGTVDTEKVAVMRHDGDFDTGTKQ
jgi:hypothetical protein